MRKVSENDEIIIYYKEKGEHTLLYSDYTKDDSLFLYRLDSVTSGILIQAKNEAVYKRLKECQKRNLIKKTYVAIARKGISEDFTDVRIKASIENQTAIEKMIDSNESLTISTYFRPYGKGRKCVKAVKKEELFKYKDKDVTKKLYTTKILEMKQDEEGRVHFKIEIENGFRHQIRSHLAFIGYPIIGDAAYGGAIPLYDEDNFTENGIALECICIQMPGYSITLT